MIGMTRANAVNAFGDLRFHWPEYLTDAGELGLYMFSTCAIATLLQHPASPVRHVIANSFFRRAVMGLGMGATVVAIVTSPWGKQSGAHCGLNGAGHFVKMVHNGIESGVMAASAEGLAVLKSANAGAWQSEADAETTPLRDPEHYQYDLNLADIVQVWKRGSVIASWLLDLTASALAADAKLTKFAGRISDSGEGRWTIKAAIDEGVPVPVLTTALYERFALRGQADYQDRLLSAIRFWVWRAPRKSGQTAMKQISLHSDTLVFFGATSNLAY
jgi:hypothetical protein